MSPFFPPDGPARILAGLGVALCLLCSVAAAEVEPARKPFVLVLIDSQTEAELGPFPLNRAVFGKAVRLITAAKPEAIALKFFFDQRKTESEDRSLAESFQDAKVLLQARLDDTEAHPNFLPARCFVKGLEVGEHAGMSGTSGWLPLGALSKLSYDVGFVDIQTADRCPVIECYQGKYVKSLALCMAELALGQTARIVPGKSVTIGSATVPLDEFNQFKVNFPKADTLSYVPFHRLLSGAASLGSCTNQIVILGYDGDKIDKIATPIGQMKAHRVFYYQALSLYEQALRTKTAGPAR